MKLIIIILLLTFGLYAQRTNYNGTGDTTSILTCSTTVLAYAPQVFNLSEFENVRIVAQANDTSSAGFASDSINFSWGYQTFTKCYNALGNTDTCWSPRVTVDTMSTANLGVLTLLSLSDGVATSPSGSSDTLSCSGYAVQSRAFAPEWDVYMILWAQGITGNKTAAPLDLQFTVIRRIYNPTRSK